MIIYYEQFKLYIFTILYRIYTTVKHSDVHNIYCICELYTPIHVNIYKISLIVYIY